MGHVIHVTLTLIIYCVAVVVSATIRYNYKKPILDCGYLRITPEEKYSWERPNFYVSYRTIDPDDIRDPSIGVLKKEDSKNYISKKQSMDLSVLTDRMSEDTGSTGTLSDEPLIRPTDNIAQSSDSEPRFYDEDQKYTEEYTEHEKVITVIKNVAVPYPVEKQIPYPVIKKVPYPIHTPVAQPYPVEKEVPYPVKVVIKVPTKVPYPVPVYKEVPYAVHVPVERPVPYRTYIPDPYPVEKKVYYESKIPVPEPYPIEKTVAVPVKIPVPVPQPYPVEKPIHYPVEVKVDRPVAVPVEKPYPVTVFKHVPYPVFKPKPVPVEVKVERPVPYPVVKHVPYPVKVEVPQYYPVEKEVPYPVVNHRPYPVPVSVDRPVPVPIENPVPVPVEHEQVEHEPEHGYDDAKDEIHSGYKQESCCGDEFRPSAIDTHETEYKYGDRNDWDHEQLIRSDEVVANVGHVKADTQGSDVKPVVEDSKEDDTNSEEVRNHVAANASADGAKEATDLKEVNSEGVVVKNDNQNINEINNNNNNNDNNNNNNNNDKRNGKKVKRLRKIIKRIKTYDGTSKNIKEKGN
ncbi:probable serine/threonine-protein kinase kinX [Microplitis mediator]|uniref:probable serine/threonine-protein kinase kinX n=1 Tax=Microplitis mediator TaxID=375433 RepID=UPI002557687A|nr:probable serine/threonine-protein kinase kinX [Microplitis mediator]